MSVDPRTSSAEPVASTESAPPTSSTIAAPPPTMSTAVSYAGGTDRNPIDGLVLSVRAAVQEEIQAALSREVRRSGGLTVGVGATSEDASTTTAASAQALLGALPPASAIASMPTLSQVSAVGQSSSRLVSMLAGPATTSPALLTPTGHSGAVVLSSTLPPISAKLAAKVSSGQFVAMKELLTDNMKLYQQLESMPTNQHLFVGAAKPRLREVDSPLTWASCFLAYVAVCTEDTRIRNLLTYGRLVIREAQRHSGPGWLEYDKIFRQHAALSPGTLWHEINPSLHSCTVLSYRAGPSQVCGLCHEPDHAADRCALQVLQPQCGLPPVPQLPRLVPTSAPASASSSVGPIRRPIRQETLERICVSWNRGRCSFPACKFRHICASCKQRGHRAKECHLESNYKTPQQGGNSAEGGGDHQT